MTMVASQITSVSIVYSAVGSGVGQRKHQSPTSLVFVREIHRWPVNSPHKGPVTRKMFPFCDVIMVTLDRHSDCRQSRALLLTQRPGALAKFQLTLEWCHNKRDSVWYHRRFDCLPNRLFRRRSKKISKLRVTGLCEGNPAVTGGFPLQRASNAENFHFMTSSWYRSKYKGVLTLIFVCCQPNWITAYESMVLWEHYSGVAWTS